MAIDETRVQGTNSFWPSSCSSIAIQHKDGFLLAGSSNFLTTGQLRESLAGRIAIVPVRPLSRGEILERHEGFIKVALREPEALTERSEPLSRLEFGDLIAGGGFPDSVRATSKRARTVHFSAYAQTAISGEAIGDAGSRRDPAILQRVFNVVTARTAQEFILEGSLRTLA